MLGGELLPAHPFERLYLLKDFDEEISDARITSTSIFKFAGATRVEELQSIGLMARVEYVGGRMLAYACVRVVWCRAVWLLSLCVLLPMLLLPSVLGFQCTLSCSGASPQYTCAIPVVGRHDRRPGERGVCP